MSSTPRTDEEIESTALEDKNHPHTDWVPAFFARQLETELTAANTLIAALETALHEAHEALDSSAIMLMGELAQIGAAQKAIRDVLGQIPTKAIKSSPKAKETAFSGLQEETEDQRGVHAA